MENQSKIKKILMSVWLAVATALSVIFIIVCIVGGVQNSKKEKQGVSACVERDIISYNINNDINKGIIEPISKNVVYDDNNYTITLSANEINDFTWNNFYEYLSDLGSSTTLGTVTYDSETVNFSVAFTPDWGGGFASFSGHYLAYSFKLVDDNYYIYNSYYNSSIAIDITSDTLFNIDTTYYIELKNAIDLDIQANQSQSVNDSVFETLSSSTVGFIGTISSGITTMIAVFYSEGNLTVIGTLAVIVVAVGLFYFLLRLMFGLVRMRG